MILFHKLFASIQVITGKDGFAQAKSIAMTGMGQPALQPGVEILVAQFPGGMAFL